MDSTAMRQFTKAEFNTEEPYKLLFSFRNNRFQFAQLRTVLSENASNVGFKGFVNMFKEYAASQANNGVIIDNSTQFEGQVLELKTGPWIADDNGVSRHNERNGEDIACVHPIIPMECLTNIDTGTEKIRIAFRKGEFWRSEIYDRRTIASANNILELANNGVAVTSENSKYLVRYLHDIENLNLDVIPQYKSVGRLGWTSNDSFSPYVADLIFDGANTFKSVFDSVKSEGDFEEWLRIARAIRATNSPAKIMLAASFASVLIKVLGKLNFMVHLWGGTEAGKTVALMLAASVWGDPGEDGYIQSFNGTPVAIELLEGFMKNTPLILDEFQLVKDKKTFENIVYMICEGIGRLRGKKTGGLQDTPSWKNCTLTSGETPITNASSGGGAVNRIIEVECKDKLFEDAPSIADTIRRNYGFAGKIFTSLLSNEESKTKAQRLYKEYYTTLGTEATEKQTSAAAIILTADKLATEWIFKDDNSLTVEEIENYLHTKESVDVCLRGYNYLKDIVAANHFKFFEVGKLQPSVEIWGTTSEGKINILKSIYEKICFEGGYDPKALASWMKQRGYSETSKDRDRNYKQVKIGGGNNWCICLVNKNSEAETDFISVDNRDLPWLFDDDTH